VLNFSKLSTNPTILVKKNIQADIDKKRERIHLIKIHVYEFSSCIVPVNVCSISMWKLHISTVLVEYVAGSKQVFDLIVK